MKKRLAELEKEVAQADGETAAQASVPSVIESVGELRVTVGASVFQERLSLLPA